MLYHDVIVLYCTAVVLLWEREAAILHALCLFVSISVLVFKIMFYEINNEDPSKECFEKSIHYLHLLNMPHASLQVLHLAFYHDDVAQLYKKS